MGSEQKGGIIINRHEALLLLNLDPFYTPEELKERWRFLAKRYHPDLGHNPEYFKRLLEAYQFLKQYRESYSAKQEWFDHVSQENQRKCAQAETHENQGASFIYPLLYIGNFTDINCLC